MAISSTPIVQFVRDTLTPLSSKCPCAAAANANRASVVSAVENAMKARPKSDYNPDMGDVLWWDFTRTESENKVAFFGTVEELAEAFSSVKFDRFTHFTELLVPAQP